MAKDSTPYGKVIMLESRKASPNGKDIKVYSVGKEYNVPKHLYDAFIEMGVCKLPDDEIEQKSVKAAPENKAITPEENKGLKLEHRGGPYYDVLDESGEPVNEKALKKKDAQALIDAQ